MLVTAASVLSVLCAVVVAAGNGPVVGKGRRRAKKLAAVSSAAVSSAAVSSAAPSALPSAPSVSAAAEGAHSAVGAMAPKLEIGPGTKVLVFGDSMVDAGFGAQLRKLVEARGGTLAYDAWTSATTTSWSKGDRLETLLFLHRPDVVIVALGANEVFLPAPEVVAPRVRAIVAKLSPRACAWVTPPLWKGETGIVGVERANASPCLFFDSGAVKVERQKDGIHPTPKGGADWASAVWAALVKE